MPMLVINSFMERMIGWEIGCDVYSVFGSISGMGQAITNAAIAFDRYRLQLFRFRHRLLFTNRDIESSLSLQNHFLPDRWTTQLETSRDNHRFHVVLGDTVHCFTVTKSLGPIHYR